MSYNGDITVSPFFIVKTNRTFEECAAVAATFDTRKQFQVSARAHYSWLYGRGLLDAACGHMNNPLRRRLSNEDIFAIAKQYGAIVEFQKGDFSAYKMAKRRGILEEVCRHMEPRNRYYTDDEIRSVAKQFSTRIAFVNGDWGAYRAAHRRNMLDEVCAHMEPAPSGFCMEAAAVLYQFEVSVPGGLTLFKVGISNRTPSKRLKDMGLLPGVKAKLTHCIKFARGRDARMAEKILHRLHAGSRYDGPPVMKNGNTEVFSVQIINS